MFTLHKEKKLIYSLLHLFFCTTVLSSFPLSANAQFDSLEKKIAFNSKMNAAIAMQKIFIHYDRPVYKTNDTLWLKGYIVNSIGNEVQDRAGIVYIEIINSDNAVVKRKSTYCEWGRFGSEFTLSKADFPQGRYVLRAYTNWMRNFGDSLFFESTFKIIDPSLNIWNINIHKYNFNEAQFYFSANLVTTAGAPLVNEDLSFNMDAGNKNLLKGSIKTDSNGIIFVKKTFDKNPVYDEIIVTITGKNNQRLSIPFKMNSILKTDLQFLPESGHLIVGKEQRIGIKAVNVNGDGVDVKGVIKNQKGIVIKSFETIHKGMGIVALTPQPGQQYTAYFNNNDTVQLPSPNTSGSILKAVNLPMSDSIEVTIDATEDIATDPFYLVVSKNGIHVASKTVQLNHAPFIFYIDKKPLSSGVYILTLYNSRMLPVNERAVFVWKKDNLQLSVKMNQTEYTIRDSVGITLSVKNNKDSNTMASFSVAVIDTSQISINKNAENLLTYMLLSSNLRGKIEEPYYYFNNPNPTAMEALMLTQGWVKYEWDTEKFKYPWENGFSLKGRVDKGLIDNPSKNTRVILSGYIGRSVKFFKDTITNVEGRFQFNNFPYFKNDSATFSIQALNKRNKVLGVGVTMDTKDFPVYSPSDKMKNPIDLIHDIENHKVVNKLNEIRRQIKADKEYLEEVVVTAKQKVRGSNNLNEDGGYDQLISQKSLDKFPKKSLLDVILDSVKGLYIDLRKNDYYVRSDKVRFIIDGVSLHFFMNLACMAPMVC